MYYHTFRCQPCGHEFTAQYKDFRIGPLAEERYIQSFHCRCCAVCLTIPSLAIRPDWVQWVNQSKAKDSKYSFVRTLVGRIEVTFAGLPWRVNIGEILCPYCQAPLTSGRYHAMCDACGSDDAVATNFCHAQTAGPWPPIC